MTEMKLEIEFLLFEIGNSMLKLPRMTMRMTMTMTMTETSPINDSYFINIGKEGIKVIESPTDRRTDGPTDRRTDAIIERVPRV